MNQLDGGRAQRTEFTTTHWSVVLAARDSGCAPAQEALETLCRAYWYPLYAYVRHRGCAPHDAEDLTQAFFAHLLSQDFLRHVAPEKGRFRSFLLASLKRFMADQWRRDHALKRGGPGRAWSLDQQDAESRYRLEPTEVNDPERLYERRWALTLLERVLEQLEGEFVRAGKRTLFAQLQPFLTGEKAGQTYAEIGASLGMTEGAIKMTVSRMRERLRLRFRQEIENTVATPTEADEEIRHLFASLGGAAPINGVTVDR
jgi:RNA polymerase sigma factor (sigma-70 family)